MGSDQGPEFVMSDSESPSQSGEMGGRAAAFETMIEQGRAAVARRDFEGAVDIYSRLLALDPENHVLFSNRSAILTQLGRYADALADAHRALQILPSWTKGHYRAGLALSGSGDWAGALAAFASGLAAEPGSGQLLGALVSAARHPALQRRFEAAHAELSALGLDQSPFVLVSVVGQELLAANKTKHAAQVLECALRIGTTSLKLRQSVLSSLSSAYWSLGQKDKALGCMRADLAVATALGDLDGEATAQGNLGMVFSSLGQEKEALAAYRHQLNLALRLGKTDTARAALTSLGSLYILLGDLENALASNQEALTLLDEQSRNLSPGDADEERSRIVDGLGRVHLARDELDAAEEAFQQLRSLARKRKSRANESRALMGLGDLEERRRRKEAALQLFLDALKAAKDVRERSLEGALTGRLSLVCQSLARWSAAQAWAQKQLQVGLALGDWRLEAAACGNLGRVFAHAGDPPNARRLYARQLHLAQDSRGRLGAQRNLGWAEEALGKLPAAVAAHRAALTLARELGEASAEAEAHAALAKLLRRQGAPESDVRRHLEAFAALTAAAAERGGASGLVLASGGLGELWLGVGEVEAGLEQLGAFLMAAQEEGDVEAERRACHSLGVAHAGLGRHREAVRYLDQELSLAKDLRDHVAMGAAYAALGASQLELGLAAEALESRKYHLAIAHITTDTAGKLEAMGAIGAVLLSRGNKAAALKVLVKALNLAKARGTRRSEARIYGRLGQVYSALERREKAFAFFQEMLRLAKSERWSEGEYEAQGHLVDHFSEGDQFHLALKAAQEQIHCAETMGDAGKLCRGQLSLGRLCASRGLHSDAAVALSAARRLLRDAAHAALRSQAPPVLEASIDNFCALQRPIPAIRCLQELGEEQPTDTSTWRLQLQTGQLWAGLGSYGRAALALSDALDLADAAEVPDGEKAALMAELGRAQAAAGDFVAAEETLLLRHEFITHAALSELIGASEANLGLLGLRKSERAQAEVHLGSAGDDVAEGAALAARLSAADDDWAGAAVHLSRALELGGADPRLLASIGTAEALAGSNTWKARLDAATGLAAKIGDESAEAVAGLAMAALLVREGEEEAAKRRLERALALAEGAGLCSRVCESIAEAPSASVVEQILSLLQLLSLRDSDGRSALLWAEKRSYWAQVQAAGECGQEMSKRPPSMASLDSALAALDGPTLILSQLDDCSILFYAERRGVEWTAFRSSQDSESAEPIFCEPAMRTIFSQLLSSTLDSIQTTNNATLAIADDVFRRFGGLCARLLVGGLAPPLFGLPALLRRLRPQLVLDLTPTLTPQSVRVNEDGEAAPASLKPASFVLCESQDDVASRTAASVAATTLELCASHNAESVLEAMDSAQLIWLQCPPTEDGGLQIGQPGETEDSFELDESTSSSHLSPADILGLHCRGSSVVLVGVVSGSLLRLAQTFLLSGAGRVVLLDSAEPHDATDAVRALLDNRRPTNGLCLSRRDEPSLPPSPPKAVAPEIGNLGTSLRRLLGTPDDCREALRVVLHLVEKSLHRVAAGQAAKPLYTTEESVRAKVGPEVVGWRDLLVGVGFCPADVGTEKALYFPPREAAPALSQASAVLQAALGLPQSSLVALSQLLADGDASLARTVRLFKSLTTQLGETRAAHFETCIPSQLYHLSGVQGIVASMGFDKLWEAGGEVGVKTIRMELTKRKVELGLHLISTMAPDIELEPEESAGPTYDRPPSSLHGRIRDLDITDMSGVDSDYGGPSRRQRRGQLAPTALFQSKRGAKRRPGASGYASESESRLRSRRRGASRERSRGCQSEDEGGGGLKGASSVEELLNCTTATVLAVEEEPPAQLPSPPTPQHRPTGPQGRPVKPSPPPPYRPPSDRFRAQAEAQRMRQAAQKIVPMGAWRSRPDAATYGYAGAVGENVVTVPESVLRSQHTRVFLRDGHN